MPYVLIVEDDDDLREVLTLILINAGYEVATAASAAEARDLVGVRVPALVVSDIAMPREDGYSLLQTLRASPEPLVASLPAIALTAFTSPRERQLAYAAGFNFHLPKPLDTPVFLKLVGRIMNVHAAVVG